MGSRAELIEDRGAAAESPEFFRSRQFYDAEGVTHTILIADGTAKVAIPALVREIDGTDLRDATSPYGYPGAAVRGAGGGEGVHPDGTDWSGTGLVSLFARERLGEPALAGGTERSVVQVHDPSKEPNLRTRFDEQIRRNAKLGYRVERLGGHDTSVEHRASFHALYTETMGRASADERYFFPHEYFDRILEFASSWLLLARTPESATAAGAVAAASDGFLHYYLGGTADAHLRDSPFKNVVAAMIELSGELDMPLNLGGGVRPGDGLEDFKRGFANSELPFRTHEIVCEPEAYSRLSEGKDGSDFFPAYRSPT